MNTNSETKYIFIGIIVAILILFGGCAISANNRAIDYEEKIGQVLSDVQVQEKRRKDLILSLVEVVEQSATYEQDTLVMVTEMRTSAEAGNVEEALTALNVVVERYPELKAVENYRQLMTELSTTENLIAQHRKTVNEFVKQYRRHVRRFPNNLFLGMFGYSVEDYAYLEFTLEDTQMPESLFGDN